MKEKCELCHTWSRDALLPEGLLKLLDQALHGILALAEVAFGHQAARLDV